MGEHSKKRGGLVAQLSACAFAVTFLFAPAAAGQDAEQAAARSAEQAGRLGDALDQYMRSLHKLVQAGRDDTQVREAIIRLARLMTPPPAIPEEARSRMIRGRTAFRVAKSPTEMKDAVEEFRRAANAAPWLGETYFNLGLAQEKAEDFAGAIRSFNLYLATQLSAKEATEARDKLVELQFLQERTQARQQLAAKVKEEQSSNRIAGRWCLDAQSEAGYINKSCSWEVKVSGDSLEIWGPFYDPNASSAAPYRLVYRGQISGSEIRGSFLFSASCSTQGAMNGAIGQDGRSLRINYEKPAQVRFPCQVLSTSSSWIALMRSN